ncbi:MAG: hypothetical protein M3O34_13580 [Chloroflexota bacterium]|nr:hypothetical protein [Chloroflexota bacterium]
MNDWDALERRLDDLVRPRLVVEPPPRVREDLLATVLRAADVIDFAPPVDGAVVNIPPALGAGLSPLAYAAVAAIIAAYLAFVGMIGGVLTDGGWLAILLEQLGRAAAFVTGASADGLLGTLALRLAEQAPWLALLPVLWFLWERDRAVLDRR